VTNLHHPEQIGYSIEPGCSMIVKPDSHTGVKDPSLATVRRRLADCAAASSIFQFVWTNSDRHELYSRPCFAVLPHFGTV
jgi:hypothetical protein